MEAQEMKGQILGTDENNQSVKLKADSHTKSLKSITTDHSGIHNKQGFSISGLFIAVANNATVNYAFKTPTVASGKIIHLKHYSFYAAGNNVRTDFYRAPTNAPINGADLVAYNHNHITPIPASTMQSIKANMDINLTGATDLETIVFGGNSPFRSNDLEKVLAQDTWYIRTFTNGTGGAVNINFYEFFYEE